MPLTKEQIVEINDIIKKSIESVFSNETFMKKMVKKISESLESKINGKIQDCKKKMEERYQDCEIKMRVLEENLHERLDALEQHSRKKNLRIYGVQETANEDTTDALISIFERSNLLIPKEEVFSCYRIRQEKDGPRPIFLQLKKIETKHGLLRNIRKLKGQRIFVTEDLTTHRLKLLKAAKEKYGMKNVWTADGRVFAIENNSKIRIGKMCDLNR